MKTKVMTLLFVMLFLTGCFKPLDIAADKAETRLQEAIAEVEEAEAERLQAKAEVERARGERKKMEAEAHAIETTTDELVKDSRLVRRLLALYAVTNGWRSALFTVLSLANLGVWAVAIYLHRKEK